jgi:hypothetical protein
MKKIILFICFILTFNYQLNAQLELKIDSIKINKNDTLIHNIEINGYDTVINYIIDEYSNDGPYFSIYCSLINNTDSIIYLNPSKTKMYFSFYFDTIHCYYEIFNPQFAELENWILLFHDSLSFQIDFWALRSELRKYYYNSDDFSFDKILTTFKLTYSDPLYNLEANKTNKVIYRNY